MVCSTIHACLRNKVEESDMNTGVWRKVDVSHSTQLFGGERIANHVRDAWFDVEAAARTGAK